MSPCAHGNNLHAVGEFCIVSACSRCAINKQLFQSLGDLETSIRFDTSKSTKLAHWSKHHNNNIMLGLDFIKEINNTTTLSLYQHDSPTFVTLSKIKVINSCDLTHLTSKGVYFFKGCKT